jgi:carboxymethylenebutenolidase
MISGRTIMTLVLAGSAALLAGCADESKGADESRGADAATGALDAGLDTGIDLEVDAIPDTAAVELDAAADAAALEPDAGPDLAYDAAAAPPPRPGILSVPADDPDVTVSELVLAAGSPAYLAVPNRVGTFAGLVLIPDAAGPTEHLRDVARRFAKTGCVALIPNVGIREESELLAVLDAALAALASQSQVGPTRTGAVGFGEGGTRALRFAATNPKVRAVVAYYATPPTSEQLQGINAAVLGQYGELDTAVDATIPDLERALKDAGKPFEKRLYPAGHGFNDDSRPGYDEAAAVAAWPYTVGWMEVYLN